MKKKFLHLRCRYFINLFWIIETIHFSLIYFFLTLFSYLFGKFFLKLLKKWVNGYPVLLKPISVETNVKARETNFISIPEQNLIERISILNVCIETENTERFLTVYI